METQFLIYRTTNLVNGKFYVGFHSTKHLDDGYLGSGKLIKRAIEKYGPENFEREILAVFDNKEDAEKEEARIVNEDFVTDSANYNIATGGNVRIMPGVNNPFYGKKHTDEAKRRISEAATGRSKPDHLCVSVFIGLEVVHTWKKIAEKLSITSTNFRGQIMQLAADPESDVWFVDELHQEAAEKHCIRSLVNGAGSKRGVKKTPEHCANISKGLTGLKKSHEHVDRINRNPEKIAKTAEKLRGQKRSIESRKKMSLAKANYTPTNKGKKYFKNPNNTGEKGYFAVGEQPDGWVNRVKL